jgi:2-polyprenyl-6-methoxyphenol hydroxylase-like FAD-dependent oxidoreductase
MEELLEKRAHELGVEIRRGHRLAGLSQDDDLVTVDVEGPDGRYRLAAQYLVGADGGHSAVRKACGIGFPGVTEEGFVSYSGQVAIDPSAVVPETGELEVPGVGRFRPMTHTRTETGMFVFAMFQPGVYRVAAFGWLPPGSVPDEREPMSLDELRAAVRRVLGGDLPMSEPAGGEPVALRRTTGANSRQADRYREGRVFLVGDAAHVHSGVGGSGLNLGMQDVLNLGWKLAAAVGGRAPAGLLDTYESERLPVGRRVIMHTRAQTALLSPGANVTALRELFGELLRERGNAKHIADLMAGADIRYDMGTPSEHPMVGGWMPDLALRKGNRVAEILRSGRPVLLDLAGRADLADAARAWTDRVDVVSDSVVGEAPAEAVLVRPDGYVAWAAGPEGTADELRAALRTWFGQPTAAGASTGEP